MEEPSESTANDEIAAVMGFSSFGNQNKRRRQEDYERELDRLAKSQRSHTEVESTHNSGVSGAAPPETAAILLGAPEPTNQVIVKPDLVESRESIYSRIPETPTKHKPFDHTKHKRESLHPDSLASFLQRGQSIPERPDLSAQQTPPGPERSAARAGALDPATSKSILEKSLEELTPQDLNALNYGVPNEEGDLVFFQMNFLEDPWERLRKDG